MRGADPQEVACGRLDAAHVAEGMQWVVLEDDLPHGAQRLTLGRAELPGVTVAISELAAGQLEGAGREVGDDGLHHVKPGLRTGLLGEWERSDVDRSGDGHYQLEGTQDESNVWGYARKPFLGRVEVVSGRVPRVLAAWMLAPQREPIVILLEAHSVGQPGPSPVKGEEPRAVRHLSCDNPADASDGLGDLGDFRGLPPESSHACRDLG